MLGQNNKSTNKRSSKSTRRHKSRDSKRGLEKRQEETSLDSSLNVTPGTQMKEDFEHSMPDLNTSKLDDHAPEMDELPEFSEKDSTASDVGSKRSVDGEVGEPDDKINLNEPAVRLDQDPNLTEENCESLLDEDISKPPSTPKQDPSSISTEALSKTNVLDNAENQPREPETNKERVVIVSAFGKRESWFLRWSDGTCAWENLPETLDLKLKQRAPNLPGVRQMSLSDGDEWFVSFDDNSFAISEASRETLLGLMQDEKGNFMDISQLVYCPSGGYIIIGENGKIISERLPMTLKRAVSNYLNASASIFRISVSKFGGWFVQLSDSECEWMNLPYKLEKLIAALIRKDPCSLIVSLSSDDNSVYFVSFGAFTYTTFKRETFLQALAWADNKTKTKPDVTFSMSPSITVNSYASIYSQFFEELRNIDDSPPPLSLGKNTELSSSSQINDSSLADQNNLGSVETRNSSSVDQESLSAHESSTASFSKLGNMQAILAGRDENNERRPVSLSAKGFSSLLSSFTSMIGSKIASMGSMDDLKMKKDGCMISPTVQKAKIKEKLTVILNKLSERHDKLGPNDPNRVAAMEMMRYINDLITLSDSPNPSQEKLATLSRDVSFFSHYTQGWLAATDVNCPPLPWLDGWFSGRFGCEKERVIRIMKEYVLTNEYNNPILVTSPPNIQEKEESPDHNIKESDVDFNRFSPSTENNSP